MKKLQGFGHRKKTSFGWKDVLWFDSYGQKFDSPGFDYGQTLKNPNTNISTPQPLLFELGRGNSCKRRTFGITPQLRNANPKYRLQGCENTREWCLLRIPTNTKAISIPQIHSAMVKLVLLVMKCELATSG